MAELRFDVRANFEEVTKLRSECEKLRAELLKTNKSTAPAIVAEVEYCSLVSNCDFNG